MKVLLTSLNSKYVHSNLALKYLYGAGKPYCRDLEIREFTINNSRDYIFNELVMGDYDAVCFSVYIWNVDQTAELAADLKKARPQVHILMGGPEVSYDSSQFMEDHPFVDFILAGEGEESFAQWCRAYAGESDFSQVPGLIWRCSEKIVENPAGAPVDFSTIPFPYETFSCEPDKVIYYESSRGCPFNCSYCISSLDRKIRELPVERVKKDLSFFLEKEVRQVKFLDRTFNWDRERTRELFSYLIQHDNGITNFHFEICADLLDQETFDLLEKARSGLFQFEIGIQSVSSHTLSAVNRSSRVAAVLNNVRKLVDNGKAHIHVDLIAGLPFEDYKSFGNSFNQVYALGADNLQLGFLKLLKGTRIREEAGLYGYKYMEKAPYQVISNDFISARELCRLKQIEEVLDLYHNRGGFEESLGYGVQTMAESPFAFFEAFSSYYYSRGFQHRSHKKEDLYRIFYEFGHSMGQDSVLEQLLQQDLERTMNFDAVKKFKRKGWNIL